MKKRIISKINFQMLYPAQGRGNILELLDENNKDFGEININKNDIRYLTIYPSSEAVCIPLDMIEEGIKIAKEKVKNTFLDE